MKHLFVYKLYLEYIKNTTGNTFNKGIETAQPLNKPYIVFIFLTIRTAKKSIYMGLQLLISLLYAFNTGTF